MADYSLAYTEELGRPERRTNRNAWIALVAVGMVAAAALGVAVSARTRSITVASSGKELQAALGDTATQASHAEVKAMANFKSQFAGMMLMNQPACRQTHQGYIACLDLVNSASKLITDLSDPEVSSDDVLKNIEANEYDVGSAVAFATMRDDEVAAASPVLARALEATDNYLTVNGIADMSKCDYVWRGVACLTLVEASESDSCKDDEDQRPCLKRIVPIIHILDDAAVEYDENGNVRRRGAGQVIGAVAGGIAGAIGGGKTGASIGAIAGPKGAAIGAVVGGVAGGVSGAMNGWNTGGNLSPWN